MTDPRVVAVVVTYNRRTLLLESLAAIHAQRRPPDVVVVVDNASDDGSADAVRAALPAVRLVEMGENLGGAGGFTVGIAKAQAEDADLIWLMDDDTVPEPDALAELLRARETYRDPAPALVASRVVWTDGADHPMNTPRRKPMASRRERRAAEQANCLPIRSASFVSVMLDAEAVGDRGLPIADFFLWNDDFEYTTRLLRHRRGLLCPASVVVHKTVKFGSTDVDPGERFYYEVRNKVWTVVRSDALGPFERVLYTGATLVRWARTLRRSGDRATLWRCLRTGLKDGLRNRPRPNPQVLGERLSS